MQGTVARSASKIGVERFGAEVVDPVERRRRRQQAQMIGALRQQAVDEGGVDAIGREHRVGDALRRILVEVEAGGAEGEIEIGDHRIELQVARDRPGDVVGDGRGADAALGADHRDDAPDRLGVGRGEQPADRAHDVERADRRDQIVADAAAHAARGRARRRCSRPMTTTRVPASQTSASESRPPRMSSPRLSDSMMMTFGVGALLIGLDRGGDAAHLDLEMRLGQAPILARGLDGGGGLDVSQNAWTETRGAGAMCSFAADASVARLRRRCLWLRT